jgi:hypothetical protein
MVHISKPFKPPEIPGKISSLGNHLAILLAPFWIFEELGSLRHRLNQREGEGYLVIAEATGLPRPIGSAGQ